MPLAPPPLRGPLPLLGDGAKGTALQAAGFPAGHAPEVWNLTRPGVVRALHAQHAAGGAAWVTANTFGGNGPRLAAARVPARWHDALNAAGVHLALRGAPGLPVLASLGPTGGEPAEWAQAYAAQARAVAHAGAHGILVETIVRLEEGLAAVRAGVAAGLPVLTSCALAPTGELLDDTPLEKAAAALAAAGAGAVGVNCGSGPHSLVDAVRRLARVGTGPVLAAPSAGLPLAGTWPPRYPLCPDEFAEGAIQLREAGATLLAGCCGVTTRHLVAARRALAG
jgi:5-methyltetrahydrofolate--homocysteine methyltransferase